MQKNATEKATCARGKGETDGKNCWLELLQGRGWPLSDGVLGNVCASGERKTTTTTKKTESNGGGKVYRSKLTVKA